jgi:hypothetical protein
MSLLVEVYERVGKIEEGLSTLEEALTLVSQTGEGHHEAELYRLKGELLLRCEVREGKPVREREAEKCFRQAITIAREQLAKAWELRAMVSLFRLFLRQGRAAEVRPLFYETYQWFSEGFDTVDLSEARDLLHGVQPR